jgi:hypothetical protein
MHAAGIETPQEFFKHVVSRRRDFLTKDSLDLRTAYHACTSLLSLRDWIFETYKHKQWRAGGSEKQPFDTKYKLHTDWKD